MLTIGFINIVASFIHFRVLLLQMTSNENLFSFIYTARYRIFLCSFKLINLYLYLFRSEILSGHNRYRQEAREGLSGIPATQVIIIYRQYL